MVLALGITGPAIAEGPYVGIAGGYTMMDLSTEGFGGTSWIDEDSDMSWHVYGGYQVNEYLAVEGGYTDLGQGKIKSEDGPPRLDISTKIELTGFHLNLKGGYPLLENLELFGKVGAFFWESKAKTTAVSEFFGTFSSSFKDDGIDPTFGLGAAYGISDQFSVRADWDRYLVGGDTDADTDVLSLGAQMHF